MSTICKSTVPDTHYTVPSPRLGYSHACNHSREPGAQHLEMPIPLSSGNPCTHRSVSAEGFVAANISG